MTTLYGNANDVDVENEELFQMGNDAHMQDILDENDPFLMNHLSADALNFDMDINPMQDQEDEQDEDDDRGLDDQADQDDQDAENLEMMDQNENDHEDAQHGGGGDGNDADMTNGRTVIGAGPLPTSYGMQLASSAGGNLTEFTKRRNWSQRVVEEVKDFLHILTPDGRLLYVSPSTQALTGHDPQQMLGKLISEFIHSDDRSMFVREFNEAIASGNPLRFFYRFRKADDTYIIFECLGHPHLASEASSFGLNSGAGFCRGFFMMARPYPSKNASMLDSFLEHKIENERLKKRIADLKREEKEDMDGQQTQWAKTPVHATLSQTESQDTNADESYSVKEESNMSNTALTRQNLDEALASSRPDSINDKMARYEGATHIETIEMLTGLRYRDGERSKGISTGAASPALVRGDAGIAILVDKDGRPMQSSKYSGSPYGDAGDKKKKLKVADEYVCTDCGTLDSPEWRKGPSGPKTLCNACGLRWAKKEKKRGNGGSLGPETGPLSGAGSQPSGSVSNLQTNNTGAPPVFRQSSGFAQGQSVG